MSDILKQIVGETVVPIAPDANNAILSRRIATGTIRASDITFHPHNPRIHPERQRQAVAGSLAELGQVKSIIINATNNLLVDGHERAWHALEKGDNTLLDCEWVVLSEEEHAKALMLLDRTGEMALYDKDNLDALLRDVQSDDSRVQTLLSELATDTGIEMMSDESWSDAFGLVPDSDRAPFQQKTFTLHDSQAETIDEAIKLAHSMGDYVDSPNENSNGNALARICETFITQNG